VKSSDIIADKKAVLPAAKKPRDAAAVFFVKVRQQHSLQVQD